MCNYKDVVEQIQIDPRKMPELGDFIELTVHIPQHKLWAGLRGTIVHCHDEGKAFEVEFTNQEDETLAFLALYPHPLPRLAG